MYDVSVRAVQGDPGNRRMCYCKWDGDWFLGKVKESIMILEGEYAIKTLGKVTTAVGRGER
jgi:hypothetical protein